MNTSKEMMVAEWLVYRDFEHADSLYTYVELAHMASKDLCAIVTPKEIKQAMAKDGLLLVHQEAVLWLEGAALQLCAVVIDYIGQQIEQETIEHVPSLRPFDQELFDKFSTFQIGTFAHELHTGIRKATSVMDLASTVRMVSEASRLFRQSVVKDDVL